MQNKDLPAVAALGIRSKASWGYDAATMEIFSAELSISQEQFASLAAAIVEIDEGGSIVGYFTLRVHDEDDLTELEHLFVEPEQFGVGIGSRLLLEAIDRARETGRHDHLTIICDPQAQGFYLKHGAEQIGEHQSSIAGRTIPILRIALE